jgi:crotonobetainyl-CoA:carnitine CoA-transferase CaiB-like acyl-CoA transferase
MQNLDLGFNVLSERNPRVVMVSMPAFGLTGPERDYICYGTTIETASGHSSLLGYKGGRPMHSSMAFGDPIAGLNGALAVLLALSRVKRTGVGQHVDLSQLEATIPLIGEYVIDAAVNGRDGEPRGNSHTSIAPHGCYPCAGDDEWVAVVADGDRAFQELASVMGQPELSADERFRTPLRRWKNASTLDDIIATWTSTQTPTEVAFSLRDTGVVVGPVRAADALLACDQLNARGFFEAVDHQDVGTFRYPGMPWRFSATPTSIRLPAPRFAEHNDAIFREMLGLSAQYLEELAHLQVISDHPIELV